jgi:hypothetical protein
MRSCTVSDNAKRKMEMEKGKTTKGGYKCALYRSLFRQALGTKALALWSIRKRWANNSRVIKEKRESFSCRRLGTLSCLGLP